MLKKFNEFINDAVYINGELKKLHDDPTTTTTVDIRHLYSVYKDSEELVKNELIRRLSGKEIKISEMYYDKNLFRWKYVNKKFLPFNTIEKKDNIYYIVFDDSCMFQLSRGLLIEYRLLIFDI